MAISAEVVKALRDKTGLGMMKCKEALVASDGDQEKAIEYLRKQGLKTADKKAGRATQQGAIGSYIHANGKIGVLVELACETDFVAKSDDFQALLKDLCMQVAATSPLAVTPDGIPQQVKDKEREIYAEQMKDKPARVLDKIIEGKLKAFYQERCLLHQPFVKEPERTVEEVIKAAIAKLGENIAVKRFCRMQLGEV